MPEFYEFYPRKRSIIGMLSVTAILIVINILVFIILTLFGFFSAPNCESTICNVISLKPSNIVQGKYLWTFITSMFMHGSFEHLFFNMISLFFVGTFVERIIGRKRYLWFYLAAGIVAGVFFAFLPYLFGFNDLMMRIFGSPDSFGVGASGAIFGLAGLLAVLLPHKKVYLIAGPLIAIIAQVVLAKIYPSASFMGALNIILTIYVFVSIFSMFSFNERTRRISIPIEMPFWLLPFVAIIPLVIVSLFVELPIANTAHFGGLVAGIIYGVYLRNRYRKKTKHLNKYFS